MSKKLTNLVFFNIQVYSAVKLQLGRLKVTDENNWLARIIRAANQIAPNGIAALALIFGILTVVMVMLVLRR